MKPLEFIFRKADYGGGSQPPAEAPSIRETLDEVPERCLDRLRRAEALALTGRTVTGFPGASWSSFAVAISDVQFSDRPAVRALRRHAAWLIVWCQLLVGLVSLRPWADHPATHHVGTWVVRITAEWRQVLERLSTHPWAERPIIHRVLAFLGA
ncbi:MAG: hypothetical protein ACR2PF_08740, partial [Rhizobiaceae bacterium]